MSRLWGDGFDYYATGTDLALRYTTYASAVMSAANTTAFGLGQCVSSFSATQTWETAAHETTVWETVRLKYNSPVTPDFSGSFPRAEVMITDGTNVQCTVAWEAQTGSIKIYSGDNTGSLLGTYPGMFILNVYSSWQIKFVVNNTTGTVTIWKDGEPTTASVTLTGANTRGSVSVVNYSTTGKWFCSGSWLMDDVFINNEDGTAPTGHPGDYRAVMQAPAGNTATTDFAASQTTITYGQLVDTSTESWSANEFVAIPFTTTVGGTMTAFSIELNAGFTGNIIGGIYDATGAGNSPGTKLMVSSVITNPSSGTVTFTLTGTQTLTKATTYWLAVLSDTAFVTKGSAGGTLSIRSSGTPYSGGLLTNALAGAGAGAPPFMSATVTVFKWTLINAPQEVGDAFFISSATVNQEDLYTLTALPVTPSSIIGVCPIVFWRKSDAGARTASLRMIANGSSDTDEGTVALSSTYTYKAPFMPLDPTGAAWTQAHLEAAKIGVKVIS